MPLVSSLPSASTLRTLALRGLRALVFIGVAGLSILLAAWLILQWGILPRVERWKPDIEAWAGHALGVHVQIARIDVEGSLWAPVLNLSDVRLIDAQGHDALRLAGVRALLLPRSLLPSSITQWQPRFEQLLVDQPRLEVRRDASGGLWLAGLPLGQGGADNGRAADWLFLQREVAVRQGSLVWIDEQRGAAPLALSNVDLVLRNTFNRHRLRVDATPPDAWGQRFSLMADMRHSLLASAGLRRVGDWRQWQGQLYAHIPLADVHALRAHVDLPFEVRDGRISADTWLQIDRARIDGLSTKLALREVALRLGPGLEPLAITTLRADVDAQRLVAQPWRPREQMQLHLRGLDFETGDGVHWTTSDFSALLTRDAQGRIQAGDIEASRLDLPVLTTLATRIPMAGPLRQLIDAMQPQGRLEQARLRWQGPLESPTSYWAAGQARALSLAGAVAPATAESHGIPGRPGLRQADIDFELTERGGRAGLNIQDGALEFPGVFELPLVPFNELRADVQWRVETRTGLPPAVSVEVRDARFANADAAGQLQGSWHTGAGRGVQRDGYLPGQLDLQVRLSRAQGVQVHRYLPLGLPEATRHYVRDAVREGTAHDVVARVRGDLWEFPFARPGSGEFHLRAQVQDGTLDYVPGQAVGSAWPVFNDVQAELVFDRQSLQIHRGSARVGGLPASVADGSGGRAFMLSQVEGGIADFAHQPTLRIQGKGRGPLSDALRYVNESPVGGLIQHALAETIASGPAELSLALVIPLEDTRHTEVKGQVLLDGNAVQFRPDAPRLTEARARVDFTTDGFTVSQGSARALGGPLSFDGGQQRDGAIRFTGQGTASAEGLRRASEMPVLAALGSQLAGQSAYRLQLGFTAGRPELTVTSNLVGMSSRLPAPLAKAELDTLPLQVSLQPANPVHTNNPAGQPVDTREWLRVLLGAGGSLASAQYLQDTGADGQTRVLRGAVRIGPPGVDADTPVSNGVSARVALPTLSLDAWSDWWAQFAIDTAGLPGVNRAGGGANAGSADGYIPSRIALTSDQFTVSSRRFNHVDATITREAANDGPRLATDWRIDVQADELAGRIDLRDPGKGASPDAKTEGRIRARLSRLSIPSEGVSAVETALSKGPERLPSLDLVVDELELRGKKLGKLEVLATNRGDGSRDSPLEWRLTRLILTLPEARFSAVGNWAENTAAGPAAGGAAPASRTRRTALSFELDLHDSGALLARLGMPGTLRGGQGTMRGQVAWQGSPLALDLPSIGGSLHLALDRGQFLRAEPGVARLLGVLSLQSLPRRLVLDFSDVFREGFTFDRVDGDVALRQGIASTNNLRIRGVQATVLTEGSADLARETQDLHVWVVPDVNAGGASLLYAAINPALGIGTLLGQLFLNKSITEATTRQFRVQGRWDDPQVVTISGADRRTAPTPAEPTNAAGTLDAASAPNAP